MIETPTVFILGAGASASYGYPCGRSFIEELCACIRNLGPNRNMDLEEHGLWCRLSESRLGESREYYDNFAEALGDSGFASIDAFLNANRDKNPKYVSLGKGAIAKVLLDGEFRSMSALEFGDDDWMGYLFQKMMAGTSTAEEFIAGNKVSFITFNYDCLFERRFYRSVRASYALSDAEATELIQDHFPIHHIYVALKTFPRKLDMTVGSKLQDWYESAQAIRTVYDAEHDPEIINAAKARLEEAERVCFLGFGFHELNMQVLGLRETLRPKVAVLTSRFDLTNKEWETIQRKYPNIPFTPQPNHFKCRDTLRNIGLW